MKHLRLDKNPEKAAGLQHLDVVAGNFVADCLGRNRDEDILRSCLGCFRRIYYGLSRGTIAPGMSFGLGICSFAVTVTIKLLFNLCVRWISNDNCAVEFAYGGICSIEAAV